MSKLYIGQQGPETSRSEGGVRVHEAGQSRSLDPPNDLWHQPPTRFEWGEPNGGPPLLLALTILMDALGDWGRALELHQEFAEEVISRLPREGFRLSTEEVRGWVLAHDLSSAF